MTRCRTLAQIFRELRNRASAGRRSSFREFFGEDRARRQAGAHPVRGVRRRLAIPAYGWQAVHVFDLDTRRDVKGNYEGWYESKMQITLWSLNSEKPIVMATLARASPAEKAKKTFYSLHRNSRVRLASRAQL